MSKFYDKRLFEKGSKNIFTFGSNLRGAHGAGAAKFALLHCGAKYGTIGFCGRSYGIPTKNEFIQTLPLEIIKQYVDLFLSFAEQSPNLVFFITPIGTGLAGWKHKDIAPMFVEAPSNCILPEAWGNVQEAKKCLTSGG